jgi:Zn-dependent membrane protease YugP
LAIYAQHKVNSTYKKFSGTFNSKGVTGADVARQLLLASGVHDVRVERVDGMLTDHYDPRNHVLRLSEGVYDSASLSAVGIAAHETGHAVQHNIGYGPLAIRDGIVPAANIGSKLATPLIFVGLFLSAGSGSLGMMLINIGIILFAVVVAFQLITLPVEFNASGRAIELLRDHRFLSEDELIPAKKVLNAAALTYVAAALSGLLNLLRLLLLANSRRD